MVKINWTEDDARKISAKLKAASIMRDALEKAEQQLDYGQTDMALAIIRSAITQVKDLGE